MVPVSRSKRKFRLNRVTQRLILTCGLVIGGSAGIANGQVAVTTHHNDSGRTGQNLTEPVLNTSNVNVNTFGKLFSRAVDGQIYAQPLYVPDLSVAGQIRNVVYVATQNDTVYAFDADDPTASLPLWHVNFGTPVPSTDVAPNCVNITPQVGVTSTPVIDTSSSTIYVVAKTKNIIDSSYHFNIHALDLITGGEKFGGPTEITAQVSGTGIDSVSGIVTLDPLQQFNRPGLLLLNGVVYVAFGSACETPPWHGWILGYSASTLQQVAVLNTTPNGSDGGIWGGGQGLLADSANNIYVMTGNGTFDSTTGGDYGDSVLKISTASSLSIVDYFTPTNQADLDAADLDLGSGGPMALPGTNLIVGSGKDGVVRVLDTANLGQFSATTNNNVQNFQGTTGVVFMGAPIYWNSPNHGPVIYIWSGNDFLKAYQLVNGTFQTTPVSQGTILEAQGYSNSVPLSLSANGNQAGTGIVWGSGAFSTNADQQTVAGILRAFDATDLTKELWDSKQNAARDDVGNYAKFSPPTIASGKVYQATFSNQLAVYGLLALAPGVAFTPAGPVNFPDTTTNTTSAPITVTITNGGNAALHVTGVTFAGTNPTDFALASDTCTGTTVAISATCTVGVTFTPSGTGARQANLQIADDASGSPQILALIGSGLAASTPAVTITPASPVMFPSTAQGVASAPVVVTVTNSGNATLNITTVSIAGTNAGDFAAATNTCNGAALAANATCTVGVTFTPGATGTRTATFQVADNASGSPQSATLTGLGTANGPGVTITPVGTVTFANTMQNVTSAPMTVTVTNSGNAALNISAVAITGANAGDFAVATNTCTSGAIAATASCTVSITFTPTAVGLRQAGLQITDNAVGSPQLVALSGMGTSSSGNGPAVTITPATLTFAGTTQGTTSSPMNLTVTNSGNAPLHISSVVSGGANVSEFVNPASSCTAAIAPNANCVIAVSFAPLSPASATNRTETITLTDDATNSPQIVMVAGTVNASAFTLTSPSTALSATVTAGQTAQYSLQLTPGAAYSGTVTMACSGAPATTSCTVANPIQLTAGTATTFSVMGTTTARSLLMPYSNRQPVPPSTLYLMLVAFAVCAATVAALYPLKLRGASTQHQLAYGGGVLILMLAVYGLAGCASRGSSSPGPGPTGTQAGTYTLTLTPTASSTTGKPLQLTPIQLTLTVN
jgi:Abnormal spindle-like microcephaly-assoc'd, ASPM-SPD-2-Hydin